MTRILQPSGGLKQKGGFADARLTADEGHRTRHYPATQHKVEFRYSGAPPLQ
jgi:hypothetical protein